MLYCIEKVNAYLIWGPGLRLFQRDDLASENVNSSKRLSLSFLFCFLRAKSLRTLLQLIHSSWICRHKEEKVLRKV